MAGPDVTKVQRGAGRLVKDPTDLSIAFPHGGTALGVVHDVRLVPVTRVAGLLGEEYGNKRVEEYQLGRDWVATGLVRAFDDDLLSTILTSPSSGLVLEALSAPNKGIAGSTRSVKLLFSPYDTTKYHGFLLYRAIPRPREMARINFGFGGNTWVVAFVGIPDATGREVAIGTLADMTL